MTKSISTALHEHFQGEVTTLAMCWKVTRTDGTVLGFTNHDQDITFSGVTYKASTGFTPTETTSKLNMSVDNLEVEGMLSSSDITEDDLIAGLYDHAEVEIFLINWADTSQGIFKGPKGHIGEAKRHRDMFVAEVRSLMQNLQQTIGEVTTRNCRATLGDSRCKVHLDPSAWQASTAYSEREDYDEGSGDVVKPTSQTSPPRHFKCVTSGTSGGSEPSWDSTLGALTSDGGVTWEAIKARRVEASVSAITDRYTFEVDEGIDEAGYFDNGFVRFTSGNNKGYEREIKTHTLNGSNHSLQLYPAAPFTPEVGDTVEVVAGCDKKQGTCKNKFDNIYNRRAEDFMPGDDQILKVGGQ